MRVLKGILGVRGYWGFFLAFDAEIKTIQKRLCELNPLLVKEITKKGKDNVGGRLTNQLMCKIENEIPQLAMQEVKKTGIIVNVPMFDGFMCDIISMGSMPIATLLTTLNTFTTDYGILNGVIIRSTIHKLQKSWMQWHYTHLSRIWWSWCCQILRTAHITEANLYL